MPRRFAYFIFFAVVFFFLNLPTTFADDNSSVQLINPYSFYSNLQASNTKQIDYYGDSTTWGYMSGDGRQVPNPAPAVFAQALLQYNLQFQYTVQNEGVNGSDACQLLLGVDGKHPAWSTQMAASKASIVIISFAINDSYRYDVPTFKGCLRLLAQQAKSSGKTVIYETSNPIGGNANTYLESYNAGMKDLAAREQISVIDQYNYLMSYLNGRSPYTLCPDGEHPTEEVYRMKGEYAAEVFSQLPF